MRGQPVFILSVLLQSLDPMLRKSADLGAWQVRKRDFDSCQLSNEFTKTMILLISKRRFLCLDFKGYTLFTAVES